jgi:transposase
MKSYSLDLREKIVAAVGRGMSKAQAARTFAVGATSVKRYLKLAEQGKSLRPGKAPGKQGKLDGSGIDLLEEDLRTRPTVIYEKRADLLHELLGVRVSKATICRTIKRLGYTRKRSLGAAERDEWLRAAWRVTLAGAVDPRRLVFVDEMGTNTVLSPLYAYAPKGRRVYAKVPRNRGANTTLIASMSLRGMGPCMAVEGATTAT